VLVLLIVAPFVGVPLDLATVALLAPVVVVLSAAPGRRG